MREVGEQVQLCLMEFFHALFLHLLHAQVQFQFMLTVHIIADGKHDSQCG